MIAEPRDDAGASEARATDTSYIKADGSELLGEAKACLRPFFDPSYRSDPPSNVNVMTERTRAPWLLYVLGAVCAAAIVAAVLVVGPASGSQTTVTRTAKAAQGVVQSTVSGSGNLQAASQLNLGFKTSGTVTAIYVTPGQHVTQGQLLATLDPQSAEVTLEQAKATLQSAEANLAKEEETDGETSTGGGSSGGNASAASVSYTTTSQRATAARSLTYAYPSGAPGATPTSTTPATAPTSTAPATTPTSTTPATPTPAATTPSAGTTPTTSTTTTRTPSESTSTQTAVKGAEGEKSVAKETVSTATREANLASAKAAVRSDTLTVQSDEQAVQDTKLYAPENGTIVSLSGAVGEVVSGSGTTKASSSSSSTGSSSSVAGAAGATGTAGKGAATSSTSSSTGSSSSAFAVLSDLSSFELVVPLSESEIGNVKDGQIATVTVEALNGSKLASHVKEVALLATSTTGAVSYDVTFQLDQLAAGIKVGMSATAEVVVKQAEGVNVPTSAITADSVTVERDGKQVRQRVVTGLAGNTSTIILSGLKAGETVVLPAASTTSSGASLTSRLAGRTGGLGGAGGLGGGGLAGAGGGAFFRGGG
jgi:HlyD family secretion protein